MTLVARLQPKTGGEEARRRHEAFIKSKGWQTTTKPISDLPTPVNVKSMSDRPAKAGAKQMAVIALRKRKSAAIVYHKEEITDEADLSEYDEPRDAPYVASFSKLKNERGAASQVQRYQKRRLQDESEKVVEDNHADFNPDEAAPRTHSTEAQY
ncbi:hypothetical protein LTR66_004347, partial [Elasticomyces elasticus]